MPERGQARRPGASVPGPKRPRWPSASPIANRHAVHPGQRTLNLRVRGSSPWRRTRSDLGFYCPRLFFSCPFCPHVCSMFARAHGPSNPGLVKNGPSRARCGGNRPGAAPSRMASPAPGSLDQWSRPSTRTPGAHPKSPVPMPSRSARPAGHRHSCDDQPLMPQARHTGYLPWMRRAAAWRSRAAAPPMWLRSKRRVRWALRLQTMPGTSERSCVTPLPTSSMSTDCV